MADFDINAHLAQMGFGRGGKVADSGDGTNEKSTIDALFDASGKVAANATKLTGAPNLSELGQHGIQKAIGGDVDGIANKMIMTIPEPQGGFFARLLHAIFLKNREITDHTGGVGGNAPIEGTFNGADFSSLVGNAGSYGDFDWSPASRADLGTFSPPNIGDAGTPIQIER